MTKGDPVALARDEDADNTMQDIVSRPRAFRLCTQQLAGRNKRTNEAYMHAAPVIPWIGGKRRLAPTILPLFPEHICYVEPFAGAGAILFAKAPSQSEIINDINGELVNMYRVLRHHPEELLRQFKWALSSRQIWMWERAKAPETLTDVQRAARFIYLQRLAFGGRVEGQSFGTTTTSGGRLNLARIEEDLSAAHFRLSDVTVEHLPWRNCVERYDRPHTLVYCDPPYWETEGYGVDFGIDEYRRMAEVAASMQGTMIISVNDHPAMRETFAALPMRSVPIKYTVGGGANAVDRAELIIGNWRGGWPEPRPLTRQETFDIFSPEMGF